MPNSKRRYVTVVVGVDIDDEDALRQAGSRAFGPGTSGPQAPDEESQSTVELALERLLRVTVEPELPGARVSSVSIRDVGEQDPRLPPSFDWPPGSGMPA